MAKAIVRNRDTVVHDLVTKIMRVGCDRASIQNLKRVSCGMVTNFT